MKRLSRIMGVTLLEIMLVLAIAAMIIVMSIRYYQTSTASSRVNATVSMVQGIIVAAENYLTAKGGYTGISGSALNEYLPGAADLKSPFGGTVAIAPVDATKFTITLNPAIPETPCKQVENMLPSTSGKIKFTNCSIFTVGAY